MDELSTETEKPSEAHKGDQADVYFEDDSLILSGIFHSACLLPGAVNDPHGMGKRCNVVQKYASYGSGECDNLGITADEPAGFFVAISDKHYLVVIKEDTDTNKQQWDTPSQASVRQESDILAMTTNKVTWSLGHLVGEGLAGVEGYDGGAHK